MLLKHSTLTPNQTVQICGSKSVSNRLIILNALFQNVKMENLSDSKDTQVLMNAIQSEDQTINIGHAGTAMRFLTSYYAIQEGEVKILTGSARMKQRPIGPLVEALRELGAEIEYVEKEGYPPLKITGRKIQKSKVRIASDISSQYITSLMLIGAKLIHGIRIELEGEITSKPYLLLTRRLLKNIGIEVQISDNRIDIKPLKLEEKLSNTTFVEVESDWSSASYFYSLAAIARQPIKLRSFKSHSYQGDSALKRYYWEFFGVNTVTDTQETLISLLPELIHYPEAITADLNDSPDIAQTLCVTAAILKIPFYFTGLKTLKIKETDRLLALQQELKKIGCIVKVTEETIETLEYTSPDSSIEIETYDDHRMAMSFAPYLLQGDLKILDPMVVEKSYPKFWSDLKHVTKPIKTNNIE
ncbi:3-phosphoshikimate 1-carboxyvinyltransferase [Chryseobacterium sp. A301]